MPFAELDNSAIGAEAHLATARELAAKGTVLLKNEGVSGRCAEGCVGAWVNAQQRAP